MKPFNLEEALAGKPVVMRDGRKVQRIVHLPELRGYPLVAVIDGELKFYTDSGEHICSSASDLLMDDDPPKKCVGWVNLWRSGSQRDYVIVGNGTVFASDKDARHAVGQKPVTWGFKYVACVKIEWEE